MNNNTIKDTHTYAITGTHTNNAAVTRTNTISGAHTKSTTHRVIRSYYL